MQLVHQFLHSSAEQYPGKTAVISDGRTITYGELSTRIQRVCRGLAAAGLRHGDRVVLHLRPGIDFVTALYAVMHGGGVAVPIAVGAPARNMPEILTDCTPAFLISAELNAADFAATELPARCRVISLEWAEAQAESFEGADPATALRPEDGAAILYTSGPEGERRGTYYTHQSLVQTALNILQATKIDASIIEIIPAPLSHSFALARLHAIFFAGGTAVIADQHHDAIVEHLRRGEGNSFAARAGDLDSVLGSPAGLLKHIGSSVRFIALRGPSITVHQKKMMLELFPHARICVDYGMTEGMYNTCLELHADRKKIETAGRRLPSVELAICDEQMKHLGRGLAGEILLRGEHLMSGIWNENRLHRDTFTEDRWLRTGDIGFIDKDGYLHILGRKEDLINLRGVRISPHEVEEKIHDAYPDYEICVVGIPDPSGAAGEIPVLCYIPHDGKTIIPSELSHALSGLLDRHKIPRIVYRVHKFPRLDNRIVRRELRRQLLEGLEHAYQSVL